MRTFDVAQEPRIESASLAPVLLLRVQLYSDRAAGTVAETHYFATRGLLYDYGNTGADQTFLPFLADLSELVVGMNHVPSPVDGDALRRELTITLENAESQGSRLLERLETTRRLENATVELSVLVLTADEAAGTSRLDLTGYDGDEHTVLYRGRVQRVGPIDAASFDLQCTSDLPTLAWTFANAASTPARDRGVRIPVPYGSVRVPAVALAVGACSTLDGEISSSETTITLADATDFPASGEVLIGSEQITYSGKSGNDLTGATRGASQTQEKAWRTGSRVCEVAAEEHAVGIGDSAQVSTIDAVYARNPLRPEEIIKLEVTEHYSAVLDDTTTYSGKTLAKVTISTGQLLAIFRALRVGEVTDNRAGTPVNNEIQQPSGISNQNKANLDIANMIDNTLGTYGTLLGDNGGVFVDWELPDSTDGMSGTIVRVDISTAQIGTSGLSLWSAPPALGGVRVKQWTGLTSSSGEITHTVGTTYDNLSQWVFINETGQGLRISRIRLEVDYTAPPAVGDFAGNAETFPLQIYADVQGPVNGDLIKAGVSIGQAASDWSSVNLIDSDDSTTQVDGSAVKFECETTNNGQATDTISEDFSTHTYVRFWFRQDRVGEFADDLLRVMTDGSNYTEFDFDSRTLAVDTWHEIILDIENDGTDTGTFDSSSILFFRFIFDYDSGTARNVWIDRITLSDGNTAVDEDYKASTGQLFEHPADVVRHVVENLLSATVDETSVGAAQTDLGSNVAALDLRAMGLRTEGVLGRLGYEFRSNLVVEEGASGAVVKMLAAESDYDWPAANESLTEWDPTGGFVQVGRDLDDLGTRWAAFYAGDVAQENGDAFFAKLALATPDSSDVLVTTGELTTAESEFGRLDVDPLDFLAVQDEASAEEVFGYYVHEGIRIAALFALRGIPWWQGLAVQVGDLYNVTPPWASSAVKARVIEWRLDFGSFQVEIRAVEVA